MRRRRSQGTNTHIKPFAWLLLDTKHIRGSLRRIRACIRRGDFLGPENRARRIALAHALETIHRRELTPRELIAIAQVYLAIGQHELDQQ